MDQGPEDLDESAPCGLLSMRPDGTLVRVNRTFLRWTGYSREELLAGKRFQDLLPVGGKMFYETHYAPLLRMQGFVNEINLDLRHQEGHLLPVLLNATLVKDASGQPVEVRTAVFTFGDRKKYERELLAARQKAEEATKAKADFLSMISHEIRTPMNAIIGIANLLQDTSLSTQQYEYVRLLRFSSENLLGLLNDILDFGKIEAGKVVLEEKHFNLRQLVFSTLYGLGVKAEEKNLDLHVDIDERVPGFVVGDPVKLGQVLTNLLSNAIKFTERGTVSVALRVRELLADAVSLDFRVSDTGIGIAEEQLGQIFEEFTQASYDIALKYGGTGLGLSISRKLLELHGSRMTVESVVGRGSTFSFTLRLRLGQAVDDAGGAVERIPDTQSIRGLRVLVAEDNAVNVFVLTQFLRKWGVDYQVVEDGRQALERARAHPFDLVLMDLQMPELNGYEATRGLRDLPEERFRHLPIIALSASTRIGMEDRLEAAGFTDFIGKPFKPEDLFTKLALYGSRKPEAPAALPPPEAPAREPEASGSVLPPLFSVDRFRDLIGDDPQALVELLTMTIASYETSKQDFQRVLEAGSREDFDFHVHKIKMTMSLLDAHGLRAALQQGRALLAEGQRDPIRLNAAIHAIQWELDTLIGFLQREVRRL